MELYLSIDPASPTREKRIEFTSEEIEEMKIDEAEAKYEEDKIEKYINKVLRIVAVAEIETQILSVEK